MAPEWNGPNDRRALLAGIGGLAAGTFLAGGRAEAGPLVPPGPPAPTPGPEPRIPLNETTAPGNSSYTHVISQSGSYYLTGNIASESGKGAIQVLASNVWIDLNGFTCEGSGSPGQWGITGPTAVGQTIDGLVIQNGTLVGYDAGGINGEKATHLKVHRVTCMTGNVGIRAAGPATITECLARNITTTGIYVENGSVSNCAARSCDIGIELIHSTAVNCALHECTRGIVLRRSVASHCMAYLCGLEGYYLDSGSVVSLSNAAQCYAGATVAGQGVEVRDCHFDSCGRAGIHVLSSARSGRILRNSIHRTIDRPEGALNGIAIRVELSALDFIIDENSGSNNDRGIFVAGFSCLVIRNAFGGAPQDDANAYQIGIGNRFGPLVKVQDSVGSTVASRLTPGNVAGTFSTTDPMANLFW